MTVTDVDDAATVKPDTATVAEDSDTNEIDVLANDYDPDGTLTLVGAAADKGDIYISDGKLVYTPNANFNGTDIVSYAVEDPDGNISIGFITVTVTPVNNDDNEIVKVIDVSHGTINDTAFSPDGKKAYVLNTDGTISVIDTRNNEVVDTDRATDAIDSIAPPANKAPQALAVSQDGARLYVVTTDATTGAGQLWVYDTTTYSQIDANPGEGDAIAVAHNPSDIAVQGNRIYVGGEQHPTTGPSQ